MVYAQVNKKKVEGNEAKETDDDDDAVVYSNVVGTKAASESASSLGVLQRYFDIESNTYIWSNYYAYLL